MDSSRGCLRGAARRVRSCWSFQLPNPDPDNDGVRWYSVYGAALGSRGGTVTIKTCADGVGCSEEVLIAVRAYPSFRNVTKELLYIYVDLDGDGVAERNPLGWAQTRTVFERYNISAPNDLCDTAVRLNLRCAPNVNVAILGVTTHRPTVLSAPARLVAEEI